jgi:hypothetical protein
MRSSHKTQSIRPSRSTRLRVAPVDGCRGWKRLHRERRQGNDLPVCPIAAKHRDLLRQRARHRQFLSPFRQNATVAASSLASLFGRQARPMSYGNDFRLSWARTGLGSKQAFRRSLAQRVTLAVTKTPVPSARFRHLAAASRCLSKQFPSSSRSWVRHHSRTTLGSARILRRPSSRPHALDERGCLKGSRSGGVLPVATRAS